jgi:DNA-binding response OmpR family regulator
MIPVRVLVVADSRSRLRGLMREIETSEGFEAVAAASPAAGMLALARTQPDLMIVDPFAGGGTAEEWRRAIAHYRAARPLGVAVLAARPSERDRVLLEPLADLGFLGDDGLAEVLESVLATYGAADPLREAV